MPTKRPGEIVQSATRSGYAIPHVASNEKRARTLVGGSAPVAAYENAALQPSSIEVEYVQEDSVARSPAVMFEIWTRNRIYQIDSEMRCAAVISRTTGQPEPTHALIGTRLTGGERRIKSASVLDVYFPIPMPGTEAVFRSETKRLAQYAHTSTIERVVMKVRKARVGSLNATPSWDEITGRFSKP